MNAMGSRPGSRSFAVYQGGRPIAGLVLRILFLLAIPAQLALADARVIELRIGEVRLTAEVADTADTRRQGLMFREFLPEDHGMLFVWQEPQRYAMWMFNTPLPLSVAFIDAEGRIVNIEEMQPHSRTLHHAAATVRYALEMEQGWFERHGIGAGERIAGLPR